MSKAHLAAGVWGVVATPFSRPTFDVDEVSLARLVRHYEAIGVTGLTVLGVFGEAAQLSTEERRAVLQTVVDAVELPMVVGATSLETASVVEEVRRAQAVVGDRLAGAMVQVNSAHSETLSRHLRAVNHATGAAVVLQDYPAVSGVSITSEALIAAIRPLSFVVAVKAEAPPTAVSVGALSAELDVPVFGGLGGIGLLDELALGSAGAMTGFSYPEGLVACVDAWEEGGYEAARTAFLPYLPLVNFEQQAKVALAIRKECLRQRGLIRESIVRPPAASMPAALTEQLLRQLHAVPQREVVA